MFLTRNCGKVLRPTRCCFSALFEVVQTSVDDVANRQRSANFLCVVMSWLPCRVQPDASNFRSSLQGCLGLLVTFSISDAAAILRQGRPWQDLEPIRGSENPSVVQGRSLWSGVILKTFLNFNIKFARTRYIFLTIFNHCPMPTPPKCQLLSC